MSALGLGLGLGLGLELGLGLVVLHADCVYLSYPPKGGSDTFCRDLIVKSKGPACIII